MAGPLFSAPGQVWVRTKDGLVSTMDTTAARVAFDRGDADLATASDVAAVEREAERQDLGRTAAAFGEGALAGGADAVIGAGKRAAQLGLAAGQEVRSRTGIDVAGVGGMDAAARAVSGGRDDAATALSRLSGRRLLADLANIGGTAAEYASDAPATGQAVGTGTAFGASYDRAARQRAIDNPEAAAAGRLTGEAGVGLLTGGVGSGIAGLAAQGAVEGALSGAAQADEAAWIKDTDTTAEALLWSAGLGGALGGGAGAGMGLLGSGLKRVAGSMYDAASDVASARLAKQAGAELDGGALPRFGLADDAAGAVAEGLPPARKLSGTLDAGEVASALKGQGLGDDVAEAAGLASSGGLGERGYRIRRVGSGQQSVSEFAEEAGADLANRVNGMKRAAEALTDADSYIERKIATVNQLAEGDVTAQVDAAKRAAETAMAKLEAAERQMLGGNTDVTTISNILGSRGKSSGFGGLRANAEREFNGALAKAKTSADVATAADRFKRHLGRAISGAKNRAKGSAFGREEFDAAEALLNDAYRGVQQHLEDAGTYGAKFADAQRDINAALSEHMRYTGAVRRGEETFQSVDASGWGVKERAATARRFKNLLTVDENGNLARETEELSDYFRTLENVAEVAKKHGLVDDAAAREISDVAGTFRQHVTDIGAAKAIRSMEGQDSLLKVAVRGVPFVGGLAEQALSPAKVLARIESTAALFGEDARQAVTSFISEGTDAARSVVGKGPAPSFARSGETARQAFTRTLGAVQKLAEPDVVASRMALALGDVADIAPGTATSLAAKASNVVGYLLAKAPGIVRIDPFSPGKEERIASEGDIIRWSRQYQVATDPASTVELLRSGHLRKEHVETLKELYPAMFSRLQDSTRDALLEAKGTIPYAKRRQLDMLLELQGAGEPSAAPAFQAAMSGAAQTVAQQAQTRPPSRQKSPNLSGLVSSPMAGVTGARP